MPAPNAGGFGMPGTAEVAGGGAGFLGGLGNFLQMSNPFMAGLSALGGLFGGGSGGASQENLDRGRGDIMSLAGHQGPIGFNTGFGQAGAGGFQFNPMMQALQAQTGGASSGLMGGGLFNSAGLQQALSQNNIAGALGQANQALGTQFNPNAFGTNMLPGMAQGLFGMGLNNQMMAGNQSGLQAQELAALRANAQPQMDRQFNQLQDRLFATGRLGSTGGAENLRGLFEAQNQQDLGFQTEAFNRAMQQQGFLGNLGAQQLGLGGQFQQQGFGQGLQGLQQNQTAGLQRLQAAQGLLGFGGDLFASQFGLGLGAQDALTSQAALGLQAGRAPWELQAGLLSGSGEHANALQGIASTEVSSGGGFLGGLFSDRRLKKNLNKIGDFNGLGWYTWDWNDLAFEVGASNQPHYGVIADEVEKVMPEAVMEVNGYKQVNYEMLLGAQ